MESKSLSLILPTALLVAIAACDPNLPPEDTGMGGSTTGAPSTTTSTTTSTTSTTTDPTAADESSGGTVMTECGEKPGNDLSTECCQHNYFQFRADLHPEIDLTFPHESGPIGSDGGAAPSNIGLYCYSGNNGTRIDLSKFTTAATNVGFPAIGGLFMDWDTPQSSMVVAQTIMDDYICEPLADDPASMEWEYIYESFLTASYEQCRNELVAEGCAPGSLAGSAYPDQWGAADICDYYWVFPLRFTDFPASTYTMQYTGSSWNWVYTDNTQCDYYDLGLAAYHRENPSACEAAADSSTSG